MDSTVDEAMAILIELEANVVRRTEYLLSTCFPIVSRGGRSNRRDITGEILTTVFRLTTY
jgi:hypothetical protein